MRTWLLFVETGISSAGKANSCTQRPKARGKVRNTVVRDDRAGKAGKAKRSNLSGDLCAEASGQDHKPSAAKRDKRLL